MEYGKLILTVFGTFLGLAILLTPLAFVPNRVSAGDMTTNQLLREQNAHLESIRKSLRAICRDSVQHRGTCGQ